MQVCHDGYNWFGLTGPGVSVVRNQGYLSEMLTQYLIHSNTWCTLPHFALGVRKNAELHLLKRNCSNSEQAAIAGDNALLSTFHDMILFSVQVLLEYDLKCLI